jgi:peptidoglycan-associated lipoprotein
VTLSSRFFVSCICLLALACGGATNEAAQRAGGDGTGSEESRHGRFTGSGGETGVGGDCSVAPVYFAYDSSELDARARAALDASARCLATRRSGARVTGMTDDRGTEEYNLALGDRRASTTARYLSNLGVDNVETHSLGEEQARGDEESGWANDRRAEIQIR